MIDIPDNILPRNKEGKTVCPKCEKEIHACTCPSYEAVSAVKNSSAAIVQLDKKGRKGKIVTLIKHLPANEKYLKALAKRLKSQTGSGGTFYIKDAMGIVEIQGNHAAKITILMKDEELKNKRNLCKTHSK